MFRFPVFPPVGGRHDKEFSWGVAFQAHVSISGGDLFKLFLGDFKGWGNVNGKCVHSC